MSESDPMSERILHDRLRAVCSSLRLAQSGVVVAAAALRHQAAERDEEIALVLEHFIAQRLAAEIERLAEIVTTLRVWPIDPDDVEFKGALRERGDDIAEPRRSQREYLLGRELH